MAQEGTIEWSPERRLVWDDFEADSHPGVYQDAVATMRYGCVWTVGSQKRGTDLFFTIDRIRLTTLFVKNLSWVRRGAADDRLLCHVQGCFDLAEETRPDVESDLARGFEGKLYPVRGSNEEERRQFSMQDSRAVLGALDRLYRDVLISNLQRYESDTNYGEDIQAQAKYDHRFDMMRQAKLDQG